MRCGGEGERLHPIHLATLTYHSPFTSNSLPPSHTTTHTACTSPAGGAPTGARLCPALQFGAPAPAANPFGAPAMGEAVGEGPLLLEEECAALSHPLKSGHHIIGKRSMIIRWPSYGHHMVIIWPSYGHHMAIIWSSCGHHMVIIWPSYGHHRAIIGPSHGNYTAIIRAHGHFMGIPFSQDGGPGYASIVPKVAEGLF